MPMIYDLYNCGSAENLKSIMVIPASIIDLVQVCPGVTPLTIKKTPQAVSQVRLPQTSCVKLTVKLSSRGRVAIDLSNPDHGKSSSSGIFLILSVSLYIYFIVCISCFVFL